MCANSASCERLFSIFSTTLTKLRNRLGTNNLNSPSELKMHIPDENLKQAFVPQNTGLSMGYVPMQQPLLVHLSANALSTITKFTQTITASTSNPNSDLSLVDTDIRREVPASKSSRGQGKGSSRESSGKALDRKLDEFGSLGSFRSSGPLLQERAARDMLGFCPCLHPLLFGRFREPSSSVFTRPPHPGKNLMG